MSRKTPIVSRREVVAGIGGLAVYAAARPVMAQGPSGTPIKIGQTLSLTGPFAQTGLIHKIVSEYYVERINKNGGLLGRPVQYVLYDDQSKPDISRTLYEKLLTADKVDLILGPYSTAPILAAMGVAQRYNKVFIQSTMGVPALATYKWHFSALVSGPEPHVSLPSKILDCYASTGNAPKTIAVVTSKFPSAEDMAKGMRAQAEKRGLKEVAFLEYQTGNLDYGATPMEALVFADGAMLWSPHAEAPLERDRFSSVGAGMRANLGGFVLELTAVRPFDKPRNGWTASFLIRPGF